MAHSTSSQSESTDSNDRITVPSGKAADGASRRQSPETDQASDRAPTGEKDVWSVRSQAERPEVPDSLTDKLQPVAEQAEQGEAEPSRISTILGPLPGRVSAKQTRDLNDTVHQILVIGLAVSSILLLVGLLLAFAESRSIPSATLSFAAALQQTLTLQPSGFLSLGLLTLMATPIIRVIGSVIVFLWERDWPYTGVTLLVLTVMIISVLVGQS